MFAQIADQIVAAISAGQFPIGSRLPTEAELASHFGVSRPSVREALSSLQFAGYVETRRGLGTLVRSTVANGMGQPSGPGLDRPSDIIDLLEARIVVEPEVIRQAALSPIPSGLRELKKLLRGMELEVARPERRAHTDLGVHAAIVRACPNPFLSHLALDLIIRMDGPLWRSIRDRAWSDAGLPREWLGHHEAILRAITDRHADEAERQSRSHLLSVLGNVASTTPLTPRDRARVATIVERHHGGQP